MFNEGIINQDFATNSRDLTFTKTQQQCKHGKVNGAGAGAVGGVHGAGAPPDAIPTAIKDRPSRFLIVGLLSFTSIVVSGQIVFLSSPRSHREKPRRCFGPSHRPRRASPVPMFWLSPMREKLP
jgi:hypothetical protein